MSGMPPPEIINGLPGKPLPFELVENILSRLPVKSLKRFRAVEKSWRHLIDSERFAKIHLHRSLTSKSNRNLFSGLLGFHWISVDSLDKEHSMNPGFEYDDKFIGAISNSCNGLVVVGREPDPPILWNPFSREYKVLPKCPLDFQADSSFSCKTTYGFGYDSINDDYKVVKVMLYMKPFFKLSEEWIYSLKSNSWRRTNGSDYDRGHWSHHVNGLLHIIVHTGPGLESMKIMGFSVETEEDYEVMKPVGPGIDTKGLIRVCLSVLDGCLALVCDYASEVVVWVMVEYRVQKSWTPLFTYPVEEGEFVRPLAYSKESDKIVLNCSCTRFTVCGVKKRTSVENFAMPCLFWPRLCVESLISPNGWAVVGKSPTEKQIKDGQPNNLGKKVMKKKR
ncbi:F-box protein cpr30 [Phtheirospermum japonicum]|uniref:F-box protein cpr30 n=1 Tax=Phtheirospermum japonicum TaxID=374723 RepID=A0A830CII1_9LAMI|nr:F-box protein cpr30 [Phtheirospermum japonicum]